MQEPPASAGVETRMQPADRTEPQRSSRGGAILAGLLWAAGAHAAGDTGAVSSQLPDMGSPENAVLSKTDEYQIGLMAMRELRSQELILEDPELTDYIQHLGSRLAAQARADDQNFQYFIIRSSEINAFATYGGFICVNSGLILLTETESDLAAVLAHETAHVRQRHIARAILAQSRMSLSTAAAMLAAMLIGVASGANGQAMEGAIAMSQGIALQQAMNFSRGEEAEADRVGIGLLAGAGFRTTAMADFFESMGRREGVSEQAGPLDMLRNHPVTRDRIAEARSRAEQQHVTEINESILYSWMRERLRVLVASGETDMTSYYARLRDRRELSDPERYGE
ncbi:MAG TPA: M48 family metalloprotease, partial [Steroidobacteraceae bacterium]